jgi:tripartite-type tricarboxylate transporter receptor subunit TctC
MSVTRRFIVGAAALFCSTVACAQAYPNKPIRFMVPFAAGSSIDVMSRLVLDDISKRTGAAFVIETKPGALGQIGMDQVAKAQPDGYTLMPSSSATHSSGPQLTKLPMPDSVNAFTHLATIFKFDLMLVVNAASGINSPEQLAALARTRKLNFGYGSATGQVGASAVARAAGIADRVVGVPYKGQPLALTDLMGGHLDFVAADIPAVAPHIRSGKLIALGVTSDKRSGLFPDVPTLPERGVRVEMIGWVGFSGPAGLPEEVRSWWARQVGLALATPSVQEKTRAMGVEPLFVAGTAFQKLVADQYQTWGRHIREAGITPE